MLRRATDNEKRLITITGGNLRNKTVRLTGHLDFFPKECFGPSNKRSGQGELLTIDLVGTGTTIETDIPFDSHTGKPRRHFRDRKWEHFFAANSIREGDTLCLERISERGYRLSLERRADHHPDCTFLEFFAGIGLVRLGLEHEGWRVVYANDIAAQKYEMYAANFSDAADHFQLGDIHRLDASTLPSASLATASFPCTDLSLAGERRGLYGDESSAFFGFVRALELMGPRRPPLVLLENVLGFLTSHRGNDFHTAMLELNKLGYFVDAFVLDAKWFVPQSRPRLFVVGSLALDAQAVPMPAMLYTSRLRPELLTKYVAAHPDIRWCIRQLPPPPQNSTLSFRDIVEDLDKGAKEWWSRERTEYLYNQMSARHQQLADTWIKRNKWSYGTVFRRVRPQSNGCKRSMAELRSDGLAGCLRTPKGGSGRQILFKAGYGQYAARLLTPRECARLMGVPDDFVIDVPLNQALFGFGDAVCVPAISWIAHNYLNPLLQSSQSTQLSAEACNA